MNIENQTENTGPQIISDPFENPSSEPTEILSENTGVMEPITEPSTAPQNIRYNAVTGEELDVDAIINGKDGKLKTVEVEYKPPSTFSTIILILFFIGMLAFIIYLPDIVVLVEDYNKRRNGTIEEVEEIPTGKLVCSLDTNTVNLDRKIERVFHYSNNKLTSAKFSTTVKGDAVLDEESLEQLFHQCEQIEENVDGLSGITVSCEYQYGKLIENEIFDYATYDIEKVSNAYLEAGGSLLEFENEEDINNVMVRMRQSGFSCDKEK